MIFRPVSPDSPLPLHYQVRESIRQALSAVAIKSQERLPSEKQLADLLNVSLITVRRAIGDLEKEGVLVRRQGVGTFAAKAPLEQKLDHLAGFVEEMGELGKDCTVKLDGIDHIEASDELRGLIDLESDEQVIRIRRVHYLDEEPMMYNITYLPASIGELVLDQDLSCTPVFRIIEKNLGIAIDCADYQIESTVAPRPVARLLGGRSPMATLMVRRTTYAVQSKRKIDFTQLYYRGDRFRYVVHLDRVKSGAASTRLKLVS